MKTPSNLPDFSNLYDDLGLLTEYLSDMLEVKDPEFRSFMENVFISYLVLPMVRSLSEGQQAIFGLHSLFLLLKSNRGKEILRKLIISQKLPKDFTEPCPEPPYFPEEYSESPLFTMKPAIHKHLEMLYEKMFGVKAELPPISNVSELFRAPDILSNIIKEEPENSFHRNLSKSTGVVTYLPLEEELKKYALKAPIKVLEEPFESQNQYSLALLDFLSVSQKPHIAPSLLFLEVLKAPGDSKALEWLASEPVLKKLEVAATSILRVCPGKLAIQSFFNALKHLITTVEGISSPLLEKLKVALKPTISFFVNYDLSKGLSRISMMLEEDFNGEEFKLDQNSLQQKACCFGFLTPPFLIEDHFAFAEAGDSLTLRIQIYLLRKYTKLIEELYLKPEEAIFEGYYETFYRQFPALSYQVDQNYDMSGKDFYKIKIKLKVNNTATKKLCYLHLSDANFVIVQSVKDAEKWANILINAKYKYVKVEQKEHGKLLMVFFLMKNCLMLHFETQEMANKVFDIIQGLKKKFLLMELTYFSSKLLKFKNLMNINVD